MPYPSETLYPSDSLYPSDFDDEAGGGGSGLVGVSYWPVDPSVGYVSSSADLGQAITFAAPWPTVVTDEETISVIDEVLTGLLTRTPGPTTPITNGLGASNYKLNSGLVLG